MQRLMMICWTAILAAPLSCVAQTRVITVHPEKSFSVEGLAVGEPVAPQSNAYHQYVCAPSEQYYQFTRCHESHFKNGVQISRTIFHSSDLIAWYVNKELRPARFGPSDVDTEIGRLSADFQATPRIYRLDATGFPHAVIATFGGVKLEPLKPTELSLLAAGQSPRIGILVDFLDDFGRSAKGHLPVYRLAGTKGFAWIASYDANGRGRLRFFAADASQMTLGKAAAAEDAAANEDVPPPPPPSYNLNRGAGPASHVVPLEIAGGVYQVPIRINDTITLSGVLDSGASDVSVPADVVLTLIRSKTISEEDFLDLRTYILADGSKVPSQRFTIKTLQVGDKILANVIASVVSEKAQILLGQSFLSRFSSWSIDNERHALILR